MLSAEAHVATDRPSRYLTQLCKHFGRKGRHLAHRPPAHLGHGGQTLSERRAVAEQAQVDWSETEGSVSLPWGTITLRTAPGVLLLRVQATSEENVRRLEELVAGHVERFGRRDGLQVSWQEPAPVTHQNSSNTVEVPGTSGGTTVGRSRHLKPLGLVAAVVLVLAAHLGLGGVLVANWHFTSGAAAAVLALVLVKAAVLGSAAARRRAAKRQ
ncbi:DUF2218 domain-containing protein [Streptomyces sp. NPDC016626]|uniref:DUF2218 domain-containing protein n=1 Tax=Streptomyces sp. NPDC016626 TaxID=3364968 RepID=UPI003702114E